MVTTGDGVTISEQYSMNIECSRHATITTSVWVPVKPCSDYYVCASTRDNKICYRKTIQQNTSYTNIFRFYMIYVRTVGATKRFDFVWGMRD